MRNDAQIPDRCKKEELKMILDDILKKIESEFSVRTERISATDHAERILLSRQRQCYDLERQVCLLPSGQIEFQKHSSF